MHCVSDWFFHAYQSDWLLIEEDVMKMFLSSPAVFSVWSMLFMESLDVNPVMIVINGLFPYPGPLHFAALLDLLECAQGFYCKESTYSSTSAAFRG